MSGRKLARSVKATVSLSLPPELVQQVNDYCRDYDVNRSAVFEVALKQFMAKEMGAINDNTERAAD